MDGIFFDSLYEGDSANGSKLAMGLTGGDFWPRIAGCQMLYRGSSFDDIDFADILAVAELGASEISPPSYLEHDDNSTFFYVVRRANKFGCQERTLVAAVKVSIDEQGNLARPRPNDVYGARVIQTESNKVEVFWYYCPIKQQSPPACFRIYYDAGTGQIDYENQIATVSYKGRRFYRYKSDILAAGRYLFVIRAEDAAGLETASRKQLEVQLDTTNPDDISILCAEAL